MSNTNPLSKFFRQPAIYIKLPSNGQFYEDGVLDMPPNGELPVYPMTAIDEITYRTADALFNGSAIVNVIRSCIPNIKDPWKIPSIDLDTILIGIRIASYGHNMEFDSNCPHCSEENTFGLDLRSVMDKISSPNYTESVIAGDIEIYFRPLSYEQQNANTMEQFNDQKLIETIPGADIPEEEKVQLINQAFVKLSEMTMNAIADSISMIRAGGDTVVESQFIAEFIKNCDRGVFNKIRDHIVKIKASTELQPLKINCQHCNKDYDTPFTLDVSNFFASGS